MDDLDYIAIRQGLRSVLVAVAQDRAVVLDDDSAWIDAERAKELRHRAILRNLPWRAVHRENDLPGGFRSSNHRLKYSA
jgi:hypothetical protein